MRKSNGKIVPNESEKLDSNEKCFPNLNEGNPPDSFINEPEAQMTHPVGYYNSILPNWICLKCRRNSNIDFEEKLRKFEILPLVDKLTAQIDYRNELDISYSIHHQDYIGVMDKIIAINKVKLDDELRNQKLKSRNDDVANREIHPDAMKLVLDAERGELAEILRKFFLTVRNKKGNQIYRDTNVNYAHWICNTIMLSNGEELNYLTILKGLSKIAHPKKRKGIDQN